MTNGRRGPGPRPAQGPGGQPGCAKKRVPGPSDPVFELLYGRGTGGMSV